MKAIKIFLSILLMAWVLKGQPHNNKVAILPEISSPDAIKVDEQRIYIVDGIKVYIYSRADFGLLKNFGKAGLDEAEFRLNSRGRKKITIDVQSDVIVINSHERVSIFSKAGEFLRKFDATPQTGFYQKAGENYILSNYFWEKGANYSNETILICDNRLKLLDELYRTQPQKGRIMRLMRGKKAPYPLFKEYFNFKVYKDKIIVADSSQGFFFSVFDLRGKHLYDIKKQFEKIQISQAAKKRRSKLLVEEKIWKYKEYINPIANEIYPAMKEFWVSSDKLYVNTYQTKDEYSKIEVMDLKGKFLQKLFLPKADYAAINRNNYIYLKQNQNNEWELHSIQLNQDLPVNDGGKTIQVPHQNLHLRTPLHYSAISGNQILCSILISLGANVNSRDRYDFTPLHYAAQRDDTVIVKMLLEAGADANTLDHYSRTPLHHAALNNQLSVAGILLKNKVDSWLQDQNKDMASQLAYKEGFIETAHLLYPLYLPLKKGDLSALKTLLNHRPQFINQTDWAGQTILHKAYRYDRLDCINYLLGMGAKRDKKDKNGYIPEYYSSANRKKRTGINLFTASQVDQLDNVIYENLKKYFFINLGVVAGGKPVLTKSYGKGNLKKRYAYASVSKILTGMMIMDLLEEGKITSLDDNVWKYTPRYKNSMPDEFKDATLTIRHILRFQSGVPHNNEATWKNGKLNLKFKPGTSSLYSTPSFGILGHIIEEITDLTFNLAVKKYIGEPVQASSFWVEDVFRAPGARIYSNIEDMAKFAAGVMNHIYLSEDFFYEKVIQKLPGSGGLIWPFSDQGTQNLTLYASGSNGTPQAYILIKPRKKLAIVILANTRNRHSFELTQLAKSLIELLENDINMEGNDGKNG